MYIKSLKILLPFLTQIRDLNIEPSEKRKHSNKRMMLQVNTVNLHGIENILRVYKLSEICH